MRNKNISGIMLERLDMRTVLKIGLLCTVLLLTGCDKIKMGNTETETELAEGQRKAEITVMSIVGNELTYREMETEASQTETEEETGKETSAEDTEAGTETEKGMIAAASDTETGSSGQTENEREIKNENEAVSGEAYTRDSSRNMTGGTGFEGRTKGEFPGGGSQDMAKGMGAVQMSSDELPNSADSGAVPADGTDAEESRGQFGGKMVQPAGRGDMFAEMTGETVYLPVGVKVHADNGKTTSFSILEEGDVLQVLFEIREDGTEMITEIWMEGTY